MQRNLIAALVLAALAGNAAAAEPEHAFAFDFRLAANEHAGHADAWKRWAEDYSREMRSSMGTMFAGRMGAGKVVKGSPYSAEVITETHQALADGNAITRRTSAAVYRDSEGRTRQESGGDSRERTVYITDPVEAKSYVLTPGAKRVITTPFVEYRAIALADRDRAKDLARERVKDRRVIRIDSTEVRIEDGRVFVDGQEASGVQVLRSRAGKEVRVENGKVFIDGREIVVPEPPVPPSAPKVSVRTIESGSGPRREEIRVQVVRRGDESHGPTPPSPPLPPAPSGPMGALPPLPPMPGIHTMRFESTAKLGKGVTTPLGMKDFDGVKAEGRSTVWTIPAGEVGNRNPINITSESWYAPELQVTVYSRHNDPRTGETVYRLAGIKRGEPAAQLFKVPEEYSLRGHGRD